MYALNGYIHGNSVVVNENLSVYNGRSVVITILDDARVKPAKQPDANANQKKAARELAGLWKTHPESSDVDGMVRAMRKGRSFWGRGKGGEA